MTQLAAPDNRNGTSLFLELSAVKKIPVEFLEELGVRDRGTKIEIPYLDERGIERATRLRSAVKAGDGSAWPTGTKVRSYGDWRLDLARQRKQLTLVEGETDCWALWFHDVPALGIPGASNTKTIQAEHVIDIQTVYIVREPGKAGGTFLSGAFARLKELRFAWMVFEIRMPDGVKDPADLHCQDPEQFIERWLDDVIGCARPLDGERGTEVEAGQESNQDQWETPIPIAECPVADPFPAHVLPASLRDFVQDAAGALVCPADYLGVPLLTLAGAAIGASRALRIKDNWWERPSLYAATIGLPGSAKSPAMKIVAAPVYQEQARRMATYRRRLVGWEEEKEESRGPKPKPSTIYVNDVTCEALASILEDNPRGVALIRDELTAWATAMDQYKSKGRGSDRQFYLAAWAGEPVAVHRKMQDDPVYVPHPFVSVCGCLPPDLLSRFQGEQIITDGFLDRLLFASPEPTPMAGEKWLSVSEQSVAAWRDTLSYLWALEMDTDNEGEKRPKTVLLNSDGRQAWERFTMTLADEVNSPSFPDFLRGVWSKMRGYCVRLSLIVHFLRLATRETDREEVDGGDVDKAAMLIRYFQSHARKVYAVLDADPEVQDAKRVLDWIRREQRSEFKRRDVFEDVRSRRFSRIEELDQPFDRLEKHNFIRRQEPPRSNGRPPGPVWLVNPLLYQKRPENPENPQKCSVG